MLGSSIIAVALLHGAFASPATRSASQPPPTGEQGSTQAPVPADVVRIGLGVTSPEIVKEVKPRYTEAAMREKIQGVVRVEAVVQTDGTVGLVRVVRSLDKEFGLDDQAVKAVKQWRFRPGKRGDAAVPVLVSIELTFKLRDKRPK